jgi:YHS domain-containing protein
MTAVFERFRAHVLGLGMMVIATMALAETAAPLNQTTDGVAMDGFDVVSYFENAAPAKGDASYAVEHQGAQWLFASQEHADAFSADPARYVPRNNGWCSYAVSEGYGAEVDFVNGWSIVDGALYLNWDQSVRDLFMAEQDKRIPAAEANWPAVSAGIVDGSVELYRHADDASVGISHPQQLP